MEELQLSLTSARVDQRNFGLWINNWQVGQSLSALVTSQLPSGELVLRVAGQQLTATSDIPIQQGAQLLLEVKQLQPVPTLRVITPPVSPAAASVGGSMQLVPALGESSTTQAMGAVAQSLQTAVSQTSLPASLVTSIGELLRRISRSDRLSQPEGLASAVKESGVFLEAGLRNGGPERPAVDGRDMKAGMFRALSKTDGAISQIEALGLATADAEALLDMKRELESGIGRITINQLNSRPAEGSAARHWQMEMPVEHNGAYHNLRIDIEYDAPRDRPDDDESQSAPTDDDQWRVRLAINPPALGAVELNLQFREGTLTLRPSAARGDARVLLNASMDRLEDALASRGIRLQATTTMPLVDQTPEATPTTGSGVDLRA